MSTFAVWDRKREPKFDLERNVLSVFTVSASSAVDAAQEYCADLGDDDERVVCVVDAMALAAAIDAAVRSQVTTESLLSVRAERKVSVSRWTPPLHAPEVRRGGRGGK